MQGAERQPDSHTGEPAQQEGAKLQETPRVPEEDQPVQSPAAPAGTPTPETPLTKELAKLKTEQALLKEIASSFTISHVIPAETVVSQPQGLSEGVRGPEENHTEESKGGQLQDVEEDGDQEQRDLEMESVD